MTLGIRHIQTLFAVNGKSLHPFQRASSAHGLPVFAPGATARGGMGGSVGGNEAPAAATNLRQPPVMTFARLPKFHV